MTTAHDTDSPGIRFDAVSKVFQSGKTRLTAINNVTLDIPAGKIFAMIGYSGAGKSTLVRMINGLEKPTTGRVLVHGTDVSSLTERELRELRTDVGMIFQQFNLFRSRTVAGNVGYPLRVAGWSAQQRRARVAELLDFVGLADKAQSYPENLSGGQKQRVGIARALASRPSVLLADEATSALDPETTEDVLTLLRSINSEFGVTIVAITHSMPVVRAVADHVAVLAEGTVVETGTVFDVFAHPQSDISRNFVQTVLHHAPNQEDLHHLSSQYPGTIISVEIRDNVRLGPLLSDAVLKDVRFEIIHGGISRLTSHSFGTLSIELTGSPERTTEVIAALNAVTPTVVIKEAAS